MPPARPSRLDALARHLPFAVDDYAAAAETFTRWRATGADETRRVVVLWGYCYAVRYLTHKFAVERTSTPSDLDAAIDEAVRRVVDSLDKVRDPSRFPHYVSVLCRRVLLNHRERRRDVVEVREDDLRTPDPDPLGLDRALVRSLVEGAIGRLPPAIQEVARMRLLERRSYQDVAEALGRPIDSVRTYYSKAIHRLREDPDLRALWLGEPDEGGGERPDGAFKELGPSSAGV